MGTNLHESGKSWQPLATALPEKTRLRSRPGPASVAAFSLEREPPLVWLDHESSGETNKE
jgi:hypothetical protein